MMDNSTLIRNQDRIVYFGRAFDEITFSIIALVNLNHPLPNAKKVLKKRVPYFIIESFQNVIRHSLATDSRIKGANNNDFFQVRLDTEEVFIESSNLVSQSNKEALTKIITKLNNSTPEELKSLSQEKLKEGNISDLGGAGLGLIEIARKSGNSIAFDFQQFNDKFYHFFMSLRLTNEAVSNSNPIKPLQLISDFNELKSQKVIALFEGEFTNEINKVIVNVFNQNIDADDKLSQEHYLSIMTLIEVIQNVSKHGLSIDNKVNGALKIYKAEKSLRLNCQNYIATDEAKILKKKLETISSYNMDKLKKEFARILKNGNIENDEKIGLGLFEMAINSKKDLKFAFQEVQNATLYSLDIKL